MGSSGGTEGTKLLFLLYAHFWQNTIAEFLYIQLGLMKTFTSFY